MATYNSGTDFPESARGGYKPARGAPELPHNTVDMSRSKCFGDRPVVQVSQGQKTGVTLWVYDDNGQAVDLSQGSYTYRFRMKDRTTSSQALFNRTCAVSDAAEGAVTCTLRPADTKYAGIFVAELAVYDDSTLVRACPYWVAINPGLDTVYRSGGITIPEVRLILRDVCPAQNLLLDDFEFDDSQIVACMRLPVDEFNETNKPTTSYTARNFPYRFHWLRATAAYLLEIAARGYARDHFAYNAGGVSVNDKDKAGVYMGLAADLKREWRDFVVRKKLELNISRGFGSLGSSYSR